MTPGARRRSRRHGLAASGWGRRLARDCSAVAAVEFALIAPVMLVMMLGTVELVNVFRVQIKLNVAAGQLAEMIAGQPSVTLASGSGIGGSLGDMCTAVSYNLLPYNRTALSALIGSVTVTAAQAPALDWFTDKACPTVVNGTGSSLTSVITAADMPMSLFTLTGTPAGSGGAAVPGYSAISIEMSYVYSNLIPFILSPSITLTAVASARPRSNRTVPCNYPIGSGQVACGTVY